MIWTGTARSEEPGAGESALSSPPTRARFVTESNRMTFSVQTARNSYLWVNRVRGGDWLAVCAVRIELCSAPNSLINRESAGIFRVYDEETTRRGGSEPHILGRLERIPYLVEQGISRTLQGIFCGEQRMISRLAWRIARNRSNGLLLRMAKPRDSNSQSEWRQA